MSLIFEPNESFDVIELEQPTKGVCFYVLTEFNWNQPQVQQTIKSRDSTFLESDPIATHPEAMQISKKLATQIRRHYRGSKIVNIDDKYREDPFHLYVVDKAQNHIARIGVAAEDYRDETIH